MTLGKALVAALGLSFGLSGAAFAEITIDTSESYRFGVGSKLVTNWETRHSNITDNSYQEIVRVLPVCVDGRRFIVASGMAGVWEDGNVGAGAGAGAGIIQVFDADANGIMRAVSCE